MQTQPKLRGDTKRSHSAITLKIALCILATLYPTLFLSIAGSCVRRSATDTTTASPAIEADRIVRVGIYQNEPKIFWTDEKPAAGLFIDLLEKIASEEGWTLQYSRYEWQEALQALIDGEIDLMPDVAYSTERDVLYDFHDTPVLESWSRVYVDDQSNIEKISDLAGKRIAIVQGSIQENIFKQLLDGFGYEAELIPCDSFQQAFEMASGDQADAAIANHLFGEYFKSKFMLSETSIDFNPVRLYFAAAAGRNAVLLDAIDLRLSEWIPDKRSPYYTSLGNWSDPRQRYRLPPAVYWAFGVILSFLVVASAIASMLRHQVRVRTTHLELINSQLQESKQRYQILAQISPVGIFHTDSNGETTYVNPGWCKITGLPEEKAMGYGWLQAVHPDDKERLSQDWKEATVQTRSSLSEYRFVHPSGKVVWVMGQAVPELDEAGRIVSYVGTITDITERKRTEDEISKLNDELELRVAQRTSELSVAMNRAQESDRLKSAFLSTMSHELRTPLNSIIGFTGMLLMKLAGPLTEEQNKQLSMVQDSARHLLNLINDVLDISKIEAGQIQFAHAEFDMRSVIQKCVDTVSLLADKKGLALSTEIGPEVGGIVGDRRRVEQILLNLLNNAIKFTERGQVRIECIAQDDRLIIHVSDTGIGIKPDDLDTLFKPFRQVDTGLTRQYEGTGLGLSICKRLIEMMSGRIWVESTWGQGSIFSFELQRIPTFDEG